VRDAGTQEEAEKAIYSYLLSFLQLEVEIEIVAALLASIGKPEERKKVRKAAAEAWKNRKRILRET